MCTHAISSFISGNINNKQYSSKITSKLILLLKKTYNEIFEIQRKNENENKK